MKNMDINKIFKVAVSCYPFLDEQESVAILGKRLGLDSHHTLRKPLSVYVHIPFCDSICFFCIYCRVGTRNHEFIINEYVKALIKEIELYGNSLYVQNNVITALYFGGGTPTALKEYQLEKIINACYQYLPLSNDVEISVEANPLNASFEKLSILKSLGVTRISAGIQSFNDISRVILGLKQSKDDVIEWIKMVQTIAFESLAIDLMYGLPGQSCSDWEQDLNVAISLSTDHISIYELYIISGTRLFNDIKSGLTPKCNENELFDMFCMAEECLEKQEYKQQIIPEFYKKVPVRFWESSFDGDCETIALGVSGYGYLNGVSYQNQYNINQYIEQIGKGNLPVALVSQPITKQQMYERDMVLGFRKGYIDKDKFEKKFCVPVKDIFDDVIKSHIDNGLMVESSHKIELTRLGRYLQSDIAVSFMKSTLGNRSKLYQKLVVGKHCIPML